MTIGELIEKQAEKYSDRIFLYFEDQKITYRDFNIIVNRVANGFQKLGLGKGDMVAIMLPNSPEFLLTLMGLNRIGAVQVPINIRFRQSEIKYILEHSEAACFVIHTGFLPILKSLNLSELPKLAHVVLCRNSTIADEGIPFSNLLDQGDRPLEVSISQEDVAACIYTSGTTGRPKGVLHTHKAWRLAGESYAFMARIGPDDHVMTPNPLFHVNAQVYSTMGVLSSGASLVLLKRFSVRMIFDQARKYRATKIVLVQAIMPWIWDSPRRGDDGENPVKNIIAGGIPKEIYYDFEKRFQLKLQTIYSLTEAPLGIMGPREGTGERKPGGVGVPMEHPDPLIKNEIRIVDECGSVLPPYEQGEIVIRNPATMRGYFKDPAETEKTKREGWIHTGDIGYQDKDGYFFFVRREKEVLRVKGELVSPTEVESVIARHPKVLETAVIGVSSASGREEEEIKAHVRLRHGENATAKEIISWCESNLADFKVPRSVEFRAEFPRSAIGRIQKSLLKKEHEDSLRRETKGTARN